MYFGKKSIQKPMKRRSHDLPSKSSKMVNEMKDNDTLSINYSNNKNNQRNHSRFLSQTPKKKGKRISFADENGSNKNLIEVIFYKKDEIIDKSSKESTAVFDFTPNKKDTKFSFFSPVKGEKPYASSNIEILEKENKSDKRLKTNLKVIKPKEEDKTKLQCEACFIF